MPPRSPLLPLCYRPPSSTTTRQPSVSLSARLRSARPGMLALGYGACILAAVERTKIAAERAEVALRVSPFESFTFAAHAALSLTHFLESRYESATEAARRAIENNPRVSFLHAMLVAALTCLGRDDEAKAAVRQLLAIQPNFTVGQQVEELGAAGPQLGPFFAALRAAGLPE